MVVSENLVEMFGQPCPLMDAKGIVEKYLEHIDIPHVSVACLFGEFLRSEFLVQHSRQHCEPAPDLQRPGAYQRGLLEVFLSQTSEVF